MGAAKRRGKGNSGEEFQGEMRCHVQFPIGLNAFNSNCYLKYHSLSLLLGSAQEIPGGLGPGIWRLWGWNWEISGWCIATIWHQFSLCGWKAWLYSLGTKNQTSSAMPFTPTHRRGGKWQLPVLLFGVGLPHQLPSWWWAEAHQIWGPLTWGQATLPYPANSSPLQSVPGSPPPPRDIDEVMLRDAKFNI